MTGAAESLIGREWLRRVAPRGYGRDSGPYHPGVTAPVTIESVDLGRMAYEPAHDEQNRRVEDILVRRESGATFGGYLLYVEHDPVITISRRQGVRSHLLATPELLARHGIALAETDRGGDITYHGPGQLVAYPILDINLFNLGVHDYMRLLESAVIDTCREYGLAATRDTTATGVWTTATPPAKLCAMGVLFRRWISMHGLAINIETDLDHFGLIVPCGLAGRPVTSLHRELGDRCPSMRDVRSTLDAALRRHLQHAWETAVAKRAAATSLPEPRPASP